MTNQGFGLVCYKSVNRYYFTNDVRNIWSPNIEDSYISDRIELFKNFLLIPKQDVFQYPFNSAKVILCKVGRTPTFTTKGIKRNFTYQEIDYIDYDLEVEKLKLTLI